MKTKWTVSELMRRFNEYRAYKQSTIKKWRLVRSLYKGDFWEVYKKHMEEYTLTPDWNYFEYVVQAYQNSVYSGSFIGTVTPVRVEDHDVVDKLNAFIQFNWNKWGMKSRFLHIGENGELYNLGAVRVDWENDALKISTVQPEELYFDPSVSNYKEGEAIFIERAINIDKLLENSDFHEVVKEFKEKNKNRIYDKTAPNRVAGDENRQGSDSKTVSFIECFIRNGEGRIDQIFILNEEIIALENLDLQIKHFPVVCYTPQKPDGNPYGLSKLNKVFNTVVTLNILDSMDATQPYRLLNRPRFVNVDGRINLRSFTEYGSTPNATFEVKGNPNEVIFYQQVPTLPDNGTLKARLENAIFQVTGVDPQYKGRTTNSIQTTGATQAFQARVTMLTDNSRLTLLEEFCEDLTRLIIDYYTEYSTQAHEVPQYSANGTNKVIASHVLDFADLRVKRIKFGYTIAASTLLPMNQSNLFDSAKALYEMQGQYGFQEAVITPQDLIRFSDFPQKDLFLQRFAKNAQKSAADTLIADLTNFASIFSRLLSQGMTEEQASQEAINILVEEKNAMLDNPEIGKGFQ